MINSIAKLLISFGLIIAALGAGLLLSDKFGWISRLPGDIYIQKKNFSFYFPLTTCILASIIISIVILFLRRR